MEAIDALPIYKFKLRKSGSIHDEQICLKASKDGILADGTQDERVISGEDAVSFMLSTFSLIDFSFTIYY